MSALGVGFARQRPGRYAQQLRRALRVSDPGRKLDLLLAAALIEARSASVPVARAAHAGAARAAVPELGTSEARHFELYTGFARASPRQSGRRGSGSSRRARRSW